MAQGRHGTYTFQGSWVSSALACVIYRRGKASRLAFPSVSRSRVHDGRHRERAADASIHGLVQSTCWPAVTWVRSHWGKAAKERHGRA